MAEVLQTNFVSGELDPKAFGRIDIKQYFQGAESLRNYLVLPQGGATRRPGLEYQAELVNKITRIDSGITISTPNGGTGANANDDDRDTLVETTTAIGTTDPYVVVHYDLGEAKTVLFADVKGAFIDGANDGAGFKIQYSTDDATWSDLGAEIPIIEDIGVTRRRTGPIEARYWRFARDGDATDLGTDTVTLAEFNLYEDAGTLSDSRIIPFQFNTEQRYVLVATEGNIRVYLDGVVQSDIPAPYTSDQLAEIAWTQAFDSLLIFHADVQTQFVQRQGSDTEWQSNPRVFDFIPKHAFEEIRTQPATAITPDGLEGVVGITAGVATFTADHVDQFIDGNGGLVRIVTFVSTTEVKAAIVIPFFNTDAIPAGSWDLVEGYEDAWSDARGWPQCGQFYEGRLFVGGTASLPANLWGSRSGLFFDFDPGQALDDEAIGAVINANEVVDIRHILGVRNLQIFTSSGEYYVPQNASEPLTPKNFRVVLATGKGIEKGIRPVSVSGSVLFLQIRGLSVREFLFNELEQSYVEANISLLSSHLLNSPRDMAIRNSVSTDESDLLLVVNGDGTIAALTTLRDQNVTAWSPLDTMGTILQVGVDFTEIYFVVEREVNGSTVRYLERFNSDHLLDSSVRITAGLPTDTFSGLDHLEGETIKVVADGNVLADVTVSGGSVTIERDAEDYVEFGCDITTEIKDMPVVASLETGTSLDGKKRIQQVMLELFETKHVEINGNTVPFRMFAEAGSGSPLSSESPLYSGRKVVGGILGWTEKAQVTLTQDVPAPITVLAVQKRVLIG